MRTPLPLIAALLIPLAGCSGRDAVRDAGDSTHSLVRVDLSYTHTASAPVADVRFDAQAHFVRYRSFDPQSVPTILGFADYDGLPLDGCKAYDGTAALDQALGAESLNVAEVSLLDAGRIDVRGPVDRTSLRAAHYPELVPFVSGVVYGWTAGGDDARPLTLGLGQPYQVTGDGGEEVGPFATAVAAPRSFPGLTVDAFRRGADLDVRWNGADETAEAMLLEVKWSARGGSRAIRCKVRDDGEFSVGREAFEAQPASLTVTASRVARAPLQAQGAGRGELTVELRDVATLQVAP